jgi:hypothetical protein
VSLAPLGAPCGPISDQSYVHCAHDACCTLLHDAPADGGPTAPRYRCLPLIEDGNACNPPDYLEQPCKRPDSYCYLNVCQQNGAAECSAPPVLP